MHAQWLLGVSPPWAFVQGAMNCELAQNHVAGQSGNGSAIPISWIVTAFRHLYQLAYVTHAQTLSAHAASHHTQTNTQRKGAKQ